VSLVELSPYDFIITPKIPDVSFGSINPPIIMLTPVIKGGRYTEAINRINSIIQLIPVSVIDNYHFSLQLTKYHSMVGIYNYFDNT